MFLFNSNIDNLKKNNSYFFLNFKNENAYISIIIKIMPCNASTTVEFGRYCITLPLLVMLYLWHYTFN